MTLASGKQKLSPTQIRLGVPVKWSLFDANGSLLLREGATIETDNQIESLMRCGAYYYTGPDLTRYAPPHSSSSGNSSYEVVNTLLKRLEDSLDLIGRPGKEQQFIRQLLHLILDLQKVCSADPNAVLGTTQLIIHGPNAVVHAMHCAMICEIVGSRFGWDKRERIAVVAAALTQNVSLIEFQGLLDKQTSPLTDEQRERVQQHPKRSAEMLIQSGVKDRRWLHIVLQHHERMDGSGYPRGLSGDKILLEARLLAIVDSYVAMTRPRTYRQTLRSQDAMKELFKQRGQEIDSQLSELFLGVMGFFAPGCLVRRLSGEVAIVVATGSTPEKVVLSNITDKHSRSLETPGPAQETETTKIGGVLNLIDYEKLVAHLGNIWPDLPLR